MVFAVRCVQRLGTQRFSSIGCYVPANNARDVEAAKSCRAGALHYEGFCVYVEGL